MRIQAAETPIAAKRPQPGRGRAIALAIGVHVAFLALIVFGVRWQSMPTPPVAADLWDKLPTKSAPPPPTPKPTPTPPKPQPAPPPKVEPKPEEAKPAPPPKPDPAIAEKIEREKKAKEERERLEEQRQEELRKKQEKEQAAKKKREEEAAAKKKLEQEQAAKRKREEQRAQEEAERARAAAATARQLEMQKYVDDIKRKILSRANVPDTVATGTEVNVRIRILPGGDVLDIVVTRSASPTYSAAIERAIRSAQPLPVPPANSELFPQFRDLNLNFRHER